MVGYLNHPRIFTDRGVLMAVEVESCIVIGRLTLPCAEFVVIPLAMLREAPFTDAKRL